MPDRKLRVFLCHASQDKPVVRELYQRLLSEDWIDPWLDEEKLLPGQDWDLEIEKAVEASDAVIVCVSNLSVTKEGYVQKEIRKVLDIALEKTEDTIFIIPVRLDDCELPRRLRPWHYVNYFPPEQRERAYERLLKSLSTRLDQLQSNVGNHEPGHSVIVEKPDLIREKTRYVGKATVTRNVESSQSKAGVDVDTGISIVLAVYFAIAALDSLASSDDTVETLLAISAFPAGIGLLWKKQFPASWIFKVSSITYLLIYGLNYRLTNLFPVLFYVAGLAAVVSGILSVIRIHDPKKPAFYSSITFASFLFLVGTYELVTNIRYSSFTDTIDILILLTSIITAVLLWRDL